jgi:hypothetical protein
MKTTKKFRDVRKELKCSRYCVGDVQSRSEPAVDGQVDTKYPSANTTEQVRTPDRLIAKEQAE